MLVGFLRTLDFILAESRKLANMIARQTPNFVCDVISLSGKKKKMLRSQKKKKGEIIIIIIIKKSEFGKN